MAKVIDQCRQDIPKQVVKEIAAHFDRIIGVLSNLNKKARKALRDYIFLGVASAENHDSEDEYVKLLVDILDRKPVDESLLVTKTDSTGENRLNQPRYDKCWKAYHEVLLPESAVDERRHSNILYASKAHSIKNLTKRATVIRQRRIDNGEFKSLPAVPDNSWVRYQFIPNNHTHQAVIKFTGKLEVVRVIQTQTLRKEHPDQHWVNAYTRYYLEWLGELRKVCPGVE